jgi:hypothetical protein
MIPKEKANELVDYFISLKSNKMSDYSQIELPTAKLCAIKIIDELIKETGSKYHYDVKKEIKKL